MKHACSFSKLIQIYVVPGLIFQSVIVGGGYGTGREIAEFFLIHGAWGGLLGMLISCLVWGAVLAVAFEFARITNSYNYQTFFRALLGKYWWTFEVIYLLIALLVLAVLGSASGEIVSHLTGLPPIVGILLMMVLVGTLTFFGSKLIEKVFVGWSVLLYSVYLLLIIYSFNQFGDAIVERMSAGLAIGNWGIDGIRYAAYNLNAIAAVLFVVPRFRQTRHAVGAGAMAGVIGIVPGILVFLILLGNYPQSANAPVPIMNILLALNIIWLTLVFQIMLFGTFIETGTGMIHAINERLANTFRRRHKPFPNWLRAAVALSVLLIAIVLADAIGIIALISRGYGLLSYCYLIVVVVPLMTIGLWRVIKSSGADIN